MSAPQQDLLAGLLALEDGLITVPQFFKAVETYKEDTTRSLAEHLEALGEVDAAGRARLESLTQSHLGEHQAQGGEGSRGCEGQEGRTRKPGRSGCSGP